MATEAHDLVRTAIPAPHGWMARFEYDDEYNDRFRYLRIVGWLSDGDGHAVPLVVCPDGVHNGFGGLDFVADSYSFEIDQGYALVGVVHEDDR